MHATGKLLLSNVTVGICMCMAFPLAYVFLKLGGVPESVFFAAVISIFISDIIGVFVLRRYIVFSVLEYILSVHVRCIVVALLACSVSYTLYDKFIGPGICRVLLNTFICILVTVIASVTIGMDRSMRTKLFGIVKNKILRR